MVTEKENGANYLKIVVVRLSLSAVLCDSPVQDLICPAIRRIAAVLPSQRQTMFFSATLEASVVHLVQDYLRNPVRLAFGSTLKPSENVRVRAIEVAPERKQEVLQRLLAQEKGLCLVFPRTKRGADELAANLSRERYGVAVIHGGRSQSQRTASLAGFQQGRYCVLIATDLASRGIHVQNIAHVINYDPTEDAESFIHRIGRTGRAGSQGVASTLFTPGQRSGSFELESKLGIRIERIQAPGDHTGENTTKQVRNLRILRRPPHGLRVAENQPRGSESLRFPGKCCNHRARASRRPGGCKEQRFCKEIAGQKWTTCGNISRKLSTNSKLGDLD